MQQPILVLGATGRLGRPVVRHLKENDFQVRVMVRDKDSARKRFDESVEIVGGDVTNIHSLEKASMGCFGVHISISGESEQLAVENVVEIASKQELQRITYISGTATFEENARFPTLKRKLLSEKAVRKSGIPYTILCPSFSMDVLPMHIQGTKAYVFGKQPHPFHWLASDDLGRMVASSYSLKDAINKRFFIHGPEAILIHETLRRYCAILHPDIKKISTMPFWLANIIAAITRDKGMKTAVEVYDFYEKVGGDGGDPAEANRILGTPSITLDEWIRQRKTTLDA